MMRRWIITFDLARHKRRMRWGVGLGLLLCATLAYAVTTYHQVDTTTTTVLTLSSLANNSRSTAAAYDNRQGQTGKGFLRTKIECAVTYAAAPNANSSLDVYFLQTIDAGANYEDTTTARMPNVVCPARAGQTTTRVMFEVAIPSERLQVLVLNNNTGQTISSGTVKLLPVTTEVK